MKHISVMTPCYNEEGNIENIYQAVKTQFAALPQYTYEHILLIIIQQIDLKKFCGSWQDTIVM